MKSTHTMHKSYDHSAFDETEFALAVSPCPQIERPNDPAANAQRTTRRSAEQAPYRASLREDEVTETLTIAWGIALAIAVAIVVYTSGG
jgi:hypothetical protein